MDNLCSVVACEAVFTWMVYDAEFPLNICDRVVAGCAHVKGSNPRGCEECRADRALFFMVWERSPQVWIEAIQRADFDREVTRRAEG